MPTDPRQFALSRLPWSRWKHEILINYLQVMAAVLRSYGLIYYVDGFAGPGRYVEDGIEGSPLLAAKHAKDLSYSHRDYDLRCINVEFNQRVFDDLESATKPYADFVDNLHGSFSSFVPEVLQRIGDQPTLFFLDPIGIADLSWTSLEPVFQRSSITELLVRFDAQTALRLTGEGKNLHETFNSVLGEADSAFWQSYLADCGDNSQAKRECLTKAYEDKLSNSFDFVGRIPIMSADDSLKYYILFATRSLKGMQVMNDVVYGVQDLRDRTLDEQRRIENIPQQMDMFEPREEDKALHELETLKMEILEVMAGGERFKRDELRGRVASQDDNFGRFSGPQFTAVLGGRSRGLSVPKDFDNLKARIQIHNDLTLGNDKVEISLKS
ncbi:MAG: three-Cys-motif partner protein TcmP [Chloroflexota bacterium]|nr:three-Cys-motif partner protein TcmP [Chloroflexota bacterium]MDE2852686.1 three-Cys-motif partner protein TcmP [Chloroflexota bacterium]MDE2948081.1 three-Cys-motif partner protein TcmP [Chloroflexota bacterium]